ncbi:hypothetical protein KAU15_01905, partial [candidate division WOR-3 bacterium]|nr:hypothetical protein [candidate division WOR-3 bacterium]
MILFERITTYNQKEISSFILKAFKQYDIYNKIKKILADEDFKKEKNEMGFENLKRFSWEKCAR